jgi:hypothetical protein
LRVERVGVEYVEQSFVFAMRALIISIAFGRAGLGLYSVLRALKTGARHELSRHVQSVAVGFYWGIGFSLLLLGSDAWTWAGVGLIVLAGGWDISLALRERSTDGDGSLPRE